MEEQPPALEEDQEEKPKVKSKKPVNLNESDDELAFLGQQKEEEEELEEPKEPQVRKSVKFLPITPSDPDIMSNSYAPSAPELKTMPNVNMGPKELPQV